jgi:hypothetical protein
MSALPTSSSALGVGDTKTIIDFTPMEDNVSAHPAEMGKLAAGKYI